MFYIRIRITIWRFKFRCFNILGRKLALRFSVCLHGISVDVFRVNVPYGGSFLINDHVVIQPGALFSNSSWSSLCYLVWKFLLSFGPICLLSFSLSYHSDRSFHLSLSLDNHLSSDRSLFSHSTWNSLLPLSLKLPSVNQLVAHFCHSI